MDRRQFLPGSGRHGAATVSRRELAKITAKQQRVIEAQGEALKAERQARQREQEERDRHSLRGFIERMKRFLNKPIRIGRRSA
jgi:hypothetical protein